MEHCKWSRKSSRDCRRIPLRSRRRGCVLLHVAAGGQCGQPRPAHFPGRRAGTARPGWGSWCSRLQLIYLRACPQAVRRPAMSCYIYQLPSWVLDDLCRNMDTLSEWDWMQFASYVITDLTQLRKIKSMERVQGVSITRELLWWWGMRQATVQQLVDLLCHLELYRAAQIVLNSSYVITDLTQLRKIKSMERVQGVSITRELLWWWGMRQATVQQLVDLLCHLELYRAAQIVLNCE
ncbi:PREDICTED: interleukin-1 receptor-associated kinase-like 2 [Galeopterus variegatus]|uniref:Interleukin-1 receptor-associated kinase-like 2 n=1 Tax=Galeopterus variegatus TaxID=482537 RepID=A0ABM0SB22_GALVR|nr:PREDICTED: interleukin-1 receptor-associated kinase-like 2 [Galeopterus variegatus]